MSGEFVMTENEVLGKRENIHDLSYNDIKTKLESFGQILK
jgi:hypothetical protein